MSQRALPRTLFASLTGLMLCLAVGSVLSSAQAADRPAVSIGEVNVSPDASSSGEPAPELGRALRAALHDELSNIAGLRPLKGPLIVSATLTRLSSERREERSKASATISLSLRRADDQVLFAELRGRASVEEASGNLASLRRAALQGAVHGALARLPEAVERSRSAFNGDGAGSASLAKQLSQRRDAATAGAVRGRGRRTAPQGATQQ